ncbi:hypothetical protein H257_16435 [Aphanomyces astaci]|uniref:Uncharacterized protein n=1 Tax=Aphanomyces astaci TaxID=112090 RepID=W4FKF6_APHAT|nr:hypothetical protein H257_16435 [Aphanomyces astaci]ETV67351.1 hypothetical protein H257_16435 [Aphanomyces astaci]|eukprot:XP_009843166.1 hypothetical protein H257_16435 [Aphanomyces astaci]
MAVCDRQTRLQGRCFRHSGGRLCKVDGCVTFARNRNWCRRHTAKITSASVPLYETSDDS